MVIRQNEKGQWCVYHCKGKDKGEEIACHDTKKEADDQHAAIQISKDRLDVKKLFNL